MPSKKKPAQPAQIVRFGITGHRMTEAEARKQAKAHAWPFYVYALCDPIGCVFYIGKGQKNRLLDHAIEAHRGEESEKAQTIRMLGNSLRYSILLSCADEETAIAHEAFFIEDLWQFGTLTNLRKETVESAIRAVTGARIYGSAVRLLDDALRMADEMMAINRACAERLAQQWPHMRAELLP